MPVDQPTASPLPTDDRAECRKALKAAAAAQDAPETLRQVRRLLAWGKAADVAACASALGQVRGAFVRAGARPLRTFVVRSVTVEPMLAALTVEAALAGYAIEMELGGFGSFAEELLQPQAAVSRAFAGNGVDLVLVLLDLEDVAGQLPELCATGTGPGGPEAVQSPIQQSIQQSIQQAAQSLAQMLRGFRASHPARLLVQGFLAPGATPLGFAGEGNLPWGLTSAVRELNRQLREVCAAIPDCVFFDQDLLASQAGQATWRDRRLWLASRLPVAAERFRTWAAGLVRTASVLFRPARKVLCTDLDNTLWGGILGEDGPGGIATGSAFPGNCYLEYQIYLKGLAARGVLLAIASKNNPADVEEAFALRSADLVVTLPDFAGKKIGWGDKVDALRQLAAELSLGLDAFVFVDDNPVECEAVRQALPEVAVVEVPVPEPWLLVERLAAEPFFDTVSVTADDLLRTRMYQAESNRHALQEQLGAGAVSREDFLASLGMECVLVPATAAPLERSVQLLAKTNQFNLTTRRHSAGEVQSFRAEQGGLGIAIRVRDRFGDLGVVGLALARLEGDTCRIDSLLLSCRVIGRGVETALLAHVAQWAQASGAHRLLGEFIPTRKNSLCASFYPDHGFQRLPSNGDGGSGDPGNAGHFALSTDGPLPAAPPWLTITTGETLA